MLALTENAVAAIRGIISSSPVPDGGIRIATETGSTSSRTDLRMSLEEEPGPKDRVLSAAEARIFLAPEADTLLDDQVLDADTSGERIRFSLRRQDLGGP